MAKPPKKPKPEPEQIETDLGEEERFERTLRRMLNTPPQPHKPIGKGHETKASPKPRRKKERGAR